LLRCALQSVKYPPFGVILQDVSTRFGQHKGALNGGRVSLQDVNGVVYKTSGALLARRKRWDKRSLYYGFERKPGCICQD
jgi:hypothetical protein